MSGPGIDGVRIAILSWMQRPTGGVGSYLDIVIPALTMQGHEIAVWYERDGPTGSTHAASASQRSWSVQALGLERALDELRDWRPDLLFNHGLIDPDVEARVLHVAPAVLLAHTYYGTCISGAKMVAYPTARPCSRTFGWPCLAHYYPRHCGGWSPVTMVREFRRQSERLELLTRYEAIVTLSTHMVREYARHRIDATCIGAVTATADAAQNTPHRLDDRWRLLFAGRMEAPKGGAVLIDALPRVARALDRPLDVAFAGDGSMRRSWQAAAAALSARDTNVRVEFHGWLDRPGIERLMAAADLLVVPSLWPEPLGLVGLEAGRFGLPVAAFAAGGIPDWLVPGVNGQLARADPPTASGLADAIVACLADAPTHARLRDGAHRVAAESTAERHVDALMLVLRRAARVPAMQ